jgi:hypothetical protein
VTDSVNDGVTGNVNFVRNAFGRQVSRGSPGWREMPPRDAADDPAIHLLRKGESQVVRPETGLDMCDRHLVVEGRQGSSERAGRVSLHDDRPRCYTSDEVAYSLDPAAEQSVERLARTHQFEILIDLDREQRQDFATEFTMLTSRDDDD